ncbi:ribonuclease III [Candidatus Uhrbacteria bacterium]|nr:ribonuclease III [Candidatus Uhrbacteria bacterium]
MQIHLAGLEAKIGYTFSNKNLLKEALTHRSYLNENTRWETPHNERLEFLGDAVVELVVTEELFNRYPEKPEGILTQIRSALVNYQMMAAVAEALRLGDFILLSRGEARDAGRARDVILANGLEALIGAVYLDGGYDRAKQFIKQCIVSRLDEVMRLKLYQDAKSVLQEKMQEERRVTPVYKVLREEGPDHSKVFTSGVYLGSELIAEGSGPSKQDAEVEAAKRALEGLDKLK